MLCGHRRVMNGRVRFAGSVSMTWVMGVGVATLAGCGTESQESVATVKAAVVTPPNVATRLNDFAIYSRERTVLRDRSKASATWIGSARSVELGSDVRLLTGVEAGTTVALHDRGQIEGDVVSGGRVTR